ncbi:fam-l protein [Plasmodium brasilianum]|uniref:Uncharacterized protein n=2 Tax=Plasmodium (Plasmodium) TaxID=418103 RepID=A0A1A8X8P8_PLAMA|nr:fam-l protein [Plasmodium brasilianum]SBT00973.1 Plasmodium exported protein (Pm-fam-a like), unknown function [Plasmodium malariae]
MPNNEAKEKKNIYNNEKKTNEKHKHSCRSSLYIEEYGKDVKKNKCYMNKTKKYFDFEKKIFEELDYKDYLKNTETIDDKEYKNVARLLKTNDISAGILNKDEVEGIFIILFSMEHWSESKAINASNILFYCVPFLNFAVIFILGMVYYYKKVIKYENS